jgi:Tfp pilus assembly protein PilV
MEAMANRVAKKMRRIYPVQTGEMKSSGFTLIENLAALLALVVVVTALLSVHLNILRAEKTTRQLRVSCRAAEAVLARQVFGLAAAAVDTNTLSDVEATSEPVLGDDLKSQGQVWERWTIAPSNHPGLGVELELGSRSASTSTPAQTTRNSKINH